MTEIIAYNGLPQVLIDYRQHLVEQVDLGVYSAATRTTYELGLSCFLRWLRENERTDLDAGAVKDWIKAERQAGSAPATINIRLQAVKAFYTWCQEKGLIDRNPAAGLRGARRHDSRRHKRDVLTDTEILRVLAMTQDDSPIHIRDKAILYVYAYTGARTVELQRANLEDVRTEAGRLVIHVQGKGRQEADEVIVLAAPAAEEALYSWLGVRGQKPGPLFCGVQGKTKGKRLTPAFFRHTVKRYYSMAGVRGDRKTTHSLRHTAITNAIRKGAKPQQVQAMARHRSLDTTMGYYHEQQRLEQPAEAFIDYGE